MRTQVLKAGKPADVKTVDIGTEPVTLERVQEATTALARARVDLREVLTECNTEVDQVKARFMPRLKELASTVRQAHELVFALVDAGRNLFEKPRTRVFDDIKVGLRKQKGKVEWEDADLVVARIKKHFPEQADILIRTKEEPNKEALQSLTAADLKKLGVSVVADCDAVEIKDTASEIDKLVDALLNGEKKKAAEE